MRVAQVFLSLLFLGFASLQLNDPDAPQWMVAYVLVAANCAAGAANRPSTVASLLLTAGLTTWAAIITMNDTGSLGQLNLEGLAHSELAREIAGLVLAASWCTFTGIHAIRRRWQEPE